MRIKQLIASITTVAAMAVAGSLQQAKAQTFHADVAPIIYNNCTECHRDGEIGPGQFITYEEVSLAAGVIEYFIQSGSMPPWSPDHNYSSLVGERYLTQEQIQTVSDWIAAASCRRSCSNPGVPNFPSDLKWVFLI